VPEAVENGIHLRNGSRSWAGKESTPPELRIDRPPLPGPERPLSGEPLSGRLVSGTRDQTCVSGESRRPRPGLLPGRMSGRPHTPATSVDTSRGFREPRGHANARVRAAGHGPEPLLPQATPASMCGELGRCPAGMATPAARVGTGAMLLQPPPDASAAAVQHAVQFPDTCGHAAASDVAGGEVLGEPVAGFAAAGGVQPAAVGAS
jgi:hypothetical protein